MAWGNLPTKHEFHNDVFPSFVSYLTGWFLLVTKAYVANVWLTRAAEGIAAKRHKVFQRRVETLV